MTIVDDNQWEPDEEFFLKLTLIPGADSENVKLGRTSIMEITILNDDGTETMLSREISTDSQSSRTPIWRKLILGCMCMDSPEKKQ